jgi:lactoylglutathione lyase
MTEVGEPFQAQSLEASLTVQDIARSLAWYRDVMGFGVTREFQREGRLAAVSLHAGAVRLLITQEDGARGERVKGEGFSLQLTTTQDVDEVARAIEARGGVLATPPADMFGVRAFRLSDPDGFRFTVSSPRYG